MTKWRKVKLGDYLKTVKTGKLDANEASINGLYPFFTCAIEPLKIDTYSYDCECVLVAGNGDLNVKYYNGKFDAYQRTYILESKCNNLLKVRYLYYFMMNYLSVLRTQVQGGIIKYIRLNNITDALIPLPPIDVQEKIAKELDSVAELLEKQKQLLTEQDTLIKSIFYDMFGDPITNDKGWKVEKLKDICTKITDGTHDTPKRYNSGILLLTGKNIRSFRIVLDEVEYVSVEDHKIIYKRCNPEYGDVLYTNIGVNYGTAAFNNIKNEFSMKNVALLKPIKNIIHGYYLQSVLNYKRECIITHNKVGGAQTFMGLETIKNIEIHTPPLSLQQKFAAIVEEIEAQKEKIKASISETQTLFNALMAKYFDEE